ncbi:hypothetical protein ABZW50_04240 [Streptomyces bacillaris]
MFGPGNSANIGSALTTQLKYGREDAEADVRASWCAVELENENGIIVAQRAVKHSYAQPNLVRVWQGPAITESGNSELFGEFFVRERGSVQNARGFHRFLTEYLGWELPLVSRYTGGESPLYPEVIFPFLYSDQHSWGSAAPRAVTQYQLREPSRRAAEFLLGFAGPQSAARRYQLDDEIRKLRTEWTSKRSAVDATVAGIGGRVVGLAELPVGARASSGTIASATSVTAAQLQLLSGEEWLSAGEVVAALQAEAGSGQSGAESAQIGDVGQEELRAQLQERETELSRLSVLANIVEQNLTLNEKQISTLDSRVAVLEDEKEKNQDVKTLLRLGASSDVLSIAEHECPTCHQPLTNAATAGGPVLDVDATLALVSSQLRTFQGMRSQAVEAANESRASFIAIQRAIDDSRTQIRELRSDLVSPAEYPSSGQIARRVAAEVRLSEVERAKETLGELLEEMQQLAVSIYEARLELNRIPKEVPAEDERRRSALQATVREQLEEFGFSSYGAHRITISEETLRPEREGVNLDTDASASDVVRTKIAYLNGIREVAHAFSAPHPGLLMLDEPRQHELEEANFRSTLHRLAQCRLVGDQIIATSAASVESLRTMLGDAEAHVIDLGHDRLLQPEGFEDSLEYPRNF